MPKMLKAPLLLAAVTLIAACDSGTSTAAPSAEAPAATGAAQKPAADWTKTVIETPEGGFRMGNPEAEAKLVEFASFTCSHCREFHVQAQQNFKPGHVKAGRVSYEYRPFILNPWDVVLANLAMCEGPDRFFLWADEIYGNQDSILKGIQGVNEAKIKEIQTVPADRQLLAVADAAGISEFARARGLPRGKLEACLVGPDKFNKLTARRDAAVQAYEINGTPSFVLDGKRVENVTTWDALKPLIENAL